jgi:hypothetical protein
MYIQSFTRIGSATQKLNRGGGGGEEGEFRDTKTALRSHKPTSGK